MKLTVFTPTYNRADKLHRVYKSLKEQTCYDFEWLIIDDGSSDNTEAVVKSFLKNEDFPVIYIRQENAGKHIAYNRGLNEAHGEYFVCLDSDDWFEKNAVKRIVNNLISNVGMISYKVDSKGNLLSDDFSNIKECVTKYELEQRYGITGEFTLVFPIEIARQYPFPKFNGEKFITEAVVYDNIDQVLKYLLLPVAITVCEYQSDGLSENLNTIMKQNPAGYCLYFMQRIDLQDNLKDRIVTSGKYHAFCIFAGNQRSKYDGKHRVLVTASRPLGLIFWLYYKLLRGF